MAFVEPLSGWYLPPVARALHFFDRFSDVSQCGRYLYEDRGLLAHQEDPRRCKACARKLSAMSGVKREQTCARCSKTTVCLFTGKRWICVGCWPLEFGGRAA